MSNSPVESSVSQAERFQEKMGSRLPSCDPAKAEQVYAPPRALERFRVMDKLPRPRSFPSIGEGEVRTQLVGLFRDKHARDHLLAYLQEHVENKSQKRFSLLIPCEDRKSVVEVILDFVAADIVRLGKASRRKAMRSDMVLTIPPVR